jgi:RNA polymerase sigma factor (sigma-70 family)
MSIATDDFKTLFRRMLQGSPEAADRLCRDYQSAIQRVVRRRLPPRLRSRYDSLDFVNDVWASFFANLPDSGLFDKPKDFVGYLARIAQHKVWEVQRQTATGKQDLERETSLENVEKAAPEGSLPGPDPTPSQIVGAEDEFEKMLRDRPPVHQQILTLLRHGSTYREIADQLNTTEKTIWRLIRRLKPEAQGTCPHS